MMHLVSRPSTPGLAMLATALAVSLPVPAHAATDRATIIREALAHNPGLKAAADRVRATRLLSRAEGRLPDPEAMFQMWQVPVTRPVSFVDAQMIMVGVSQTFPAPGSLPARERALARSATAEEAMLADRARDLVRDLEHAYADLTEATARHHAHLEHHVVIESLRTAAQARQAAGGSLDDVTQAELELARLDADVAAESASIVRAKTRLNGFLGRPFGAPLDDPEPQRHETVSLPTDELVQLAQRTRPDLRAAQARVDADRATLDSADREATLPSFKAGALYFAPTNVAPFHGYGISASMTLPWIWGEAAGRRDAQRALQQASSYDAADVQLRVGIDVGTAAATVHASAERLRALRDGALPAARRAYDVGFATYATGRGNLLGVLRAQQAVVDTDIDIVMAQSSMDHALADLDWAVGTTLPRSPIDAAAPAGHAKEEKP